jgi:hypothetical protein
VLQIAASKKDGSKAIAGDSEVLKHAFALVRSVCRRLQRKCEPIRAQLPAVMKAFTTFLALPAEKKDLDALLEAKISDDDQSYAARAECTTALGAVIACMSPAEFLGGPAPAAPASGSDAKGSDAKAAAAPVVYPGYAQAVFPLLYGNYSYPCHRVRAAAHDTFGNIAELIGQEFTPHLEKLMAAGECVMRPLDASYTMTVVDGDHAKSERM